MEVAELFQRGHSQVVHLPEAYRVPGTQVYVNKVGNVVMLIPEQYSWRSLTDSLNQFSDDFMARREQPGQQRE